VGRIAPENDLNFTHYVGRRSGERVVIRPAEAGQETLMYFESLSLEPETASGRLGRLD